MTPEEFLEELGVTPKLADFPLLLELYEKFNAKVPFESASKIVRDAEIGAISEKPRTPEILFREHAERGAGGTCFSRTAAFAVLSEELGFSPVRILASISGPRSHAALLFAVGGKTWLVDPGFPLPEIRPLESGPFDTAFGSCVLDAGEDRAVLRYVSGPERGRVIDYALSPAGGDEFRSAWEATFSARSLFLRDVVLRRRDDYRLLRYFRGEVQISDAHTRTFVPLLSGRAARLSEIFSMDEELLGRALAAIGDADPPRRTARVEAYRETPEAARLFSELASAEGYRRFVSGIGDAEIETTGPGRFRVVLRNPSGGQVVEEIEAERDRENLRVRRSGGLTDSGFALDRETGEPRLVRYAELPDAREEFLRSDMGRGRIAGLLAMDLLALSRG